MPFAGEKVNVLTNFGDLEAWIFADGIEVALGYGHVAPWTAKWDVHFGRITMSPRTSSALIVETSPKATKRDHDAAKALADALRSITPAVIGPNDRSESMKGETAFGDIDSNAQITLTVGVHPPPRALELPEK
jgi:hypothetical protein